MALSIKDEETDRLVRELARRHGTSMTGAIRIAVRNELARAALRDDDRAAAVRKGVMDAQLLYRAMPDAGAPLSDDDILGYDDRGIPSR